MPTKLDAVAHTLDRYFGRWNPDVDQVEQVSLLFQIGNPRSKSATTQGRFEGKISSFRRQIVEMLKHDFRSSYGHPLGIESRQPTSDRIRVDIMTSAKRTRKQRLRNGRFPSA